MNLTFKEDLIRALIDKVISVRTYLFIIAEYRKELLSEISNN